MKKSSLKPRFDLSRYLPMGLDWKKETAHFGYWLAGGAIWALMFFTLQFVPRLNDLWRWEDGKRVLIPGSVMPDFYLLMNYVNVFYFMIGCSMAFVVWRYYQHHSQGSMSIYLMRRLPDRWELHRRCLVFPFIGVVLCLLAAFVTVVLFYAWYMLVVPNECLTPGQWQKYWRFL